MSAFLALIVMLVCSAFFTTIDAFHSALRMRRSITVYPSTALTMKVGDPIFCVNVNLYVKPERREEFIQVIKGNQKGTLTTEPLAVLYVWGPSVVDPCTFHFQEQYHGRDGFEFHTKSKHFKVWEDFTRTDPFTKPPEVMLFELM